jgi:hypothetical protein
MSDEGRKPVTEWEKMREQRESWPGLCIVDGVIVIDGEAELTGTKSRVGQRVDMSRWSDPEDDD